MFRGKMVTTAIPERVFMLYRMLKNKPMSNSDLRKKLEPVSTKKDTSYYADVRTCTEELGLISIADDMLSLNRDIEPLKTIRDLRIYVNNYLEHFQGEPFYKVTQAVFESNINDLKKVTNIGSMSASLSEKLDISIDRTQMLGWRFWASFLGFGQVYGVNSFFPNAAPCIQDVILKSNMEEKNDYFMSDFISALTPKLNILFGDTSKKMLNYGVSSGLRTLHDQHYLTLKHGLDQGDMWSLYSMKSHLIVSTVNRVTIDKKGVL